MGVYALFEQPDAPAPAKKSETLVELERKSHDAHLALEAAEREYDSLVYDISVGRADPAARGAAADSLAAARDAAADSLAAVRECQRREHEGMVEHDAAEDAHRWSHVDELIEQRAAAVAELQRTAQAMADALMAVNRISTEIWNATPRRPAYTPASWAMSHPLLVWLHAVTDGAVAVRGVVDSPWTLRQRPDLVAQAEADHAIIRGERR